MALKKSLSVLLLLVTLPSPTMQVRNEDEKHEHVKEIKNMAKKDTVAGCNAQTCCKCKAPYSNPDAIPPVVGPEPGWSRMTNSEGMPDDPDWVIMWSCRGKCTACDLGEVTDEEERTRLTKLGYGYGFADEGPRFKSPEHFENTKATAKQAHAACKEEFNKQQKEQLEKKKDEAVTDARNKAEEEAKAAGKEVDFDEQTFIHDFMADPENEPEVAVVPDELEDIMTVLE